MNAQEITAAITEKVTGFTSLYVAKPNQHLSPIIELGRVFPATKAQAKKITTVDVLYNTDVDQLIEPLMNRHGFKGEYKLTKSGRNCRLINVGDYLKALKKEFNF